MAFFTSTQVIIPKSTSEPNSSCENARLPVIAPSARKRVSLRICFPRNYITVGVPGSEPLTAKDVARTARVGCTVQDSALLQDYGGGTAIAPFARDHDLVTQRGQLVSDRLRDATLEVNLAGYEFVESEGAEEVLRLEARRLDSFLRRHAEVDHIQHRLQHRLILIIPAGGRHFERKLAVFRHHRRTQRHPRTLAGRHVVGMAGRAD